MASGEAGQAREVQEVIGRPRTKNKFFVNVPADVYDVLFEENPRPSQARLSELLRKGLEYERMKRSVPDLPQDEAPRAEPKPAGEGVPVCHDRPMVDYGDFWHCMIGQETVPK